MNRSGKPVAIAIVLIVGFFFYRRIVATPSLPVRVDVYAICGSCGLDRVEVDGLIKTFAESNLSRAEALEKYKETFDGPAQVDCEYCAEAVLDAAGVEYAIGNGWLRVAGERGGGVPLGEAFSMGGCGVQRPREALGRTGQGGRPRRGAV